MEIVPFHAGRAGVADDAEIHFVGQVARLNPDTVRSFDDAGIIPVVDRNKTDAGQLFLHLSDPLFVAADIRFLCSLGQSSGKHNLSAKDIKELIRTRRFS